MEIIVSYLKNILITDRSKTIALLFFIFILKQLYPISQNNLSTLYYHVHFYGNYSPFVNQSNQTTDMPTIADFVDSGFYNSQKSDSLFMRIQKEENEEEKNRLNFFTSLDSMYFLNKKWGYPVEFVHSYTPLESLTASPTIVYEIKKELELNEYLFSKKNDKIMLLEDIKYKYETFYYSKKYYKFKIKKNALYAKVNGRYSLLFDRKKNKNGIKNYYGRFFYNQHYKTVSFLNYHFSDIFEFYLIDLKSSQKEIYLLWFDKDYNLIRKENINIGVINEGIILVNK